MNYILTGTNAYPHKFSATNTKLELLSIGLIKNGDKCTIIDNMVGTDFKINKFEGISSTGIPYINIKKKHNRIISWLINMPNYCNLLNRLKSDSDKNIFICTQPDFLQLIIYSVICKIKGFLFISIYHEWPLALNMPWYKRFSSVLYVKYFGYLCDAILPISEALIDKCKPFNKPIFKLPILADFSKECIHNNNNTIYKDSFVYCSTIEYKRIISHVIKSYEIYRDKNGDKKLTLIISGRRDEINNLKQEINKKRLENFIFILSQIPQNDLYDIFDNALALLIPLDPNSQQDKYRFSQKIAEYLSSKRPIITNPVGDIKFYFKNKENAYFPYNFSPDALSDTMLEISNNPKMAIEVGFNGFKLGYECFNNNNIAMQLSKFIYQIK